LLDYIRPTGARRRWLDVTYCTVGVWQRYANMHAAAAPLAGCVACFYWLNPSVAADRNTALLSVADPKLLRYKMQPAPKNGRIMATKSFVSANNRNRNSDREYQRYFADCLSSKIVVIVLNALFICATIV
jgi:hypothetical protein